MKIQYASDLHIETPGNWEYLLRNPLKPVGDILILAGDTIGDFGTQNHVTHPFWDFVSQNFAETIVLLGNREFYNEYDFSIFKDNCRHKIRHNVYCYYNGIVQYKNVDIILSPMWAHVELKDVLFVENIYNFNRLMYNKQHLTVEAFNAENKRCVNYIKGMVTNSTAQYKVVVTHHLPSFRLCAPEFRYTQAIGAFAANLDDYILNSDINYWLYGHSHRNINKVIGNTQCLSNQLGYVNQNEHSSFSVNKVIEI